MFLFEGICCGLGKNILTKSISIMSTWNLLLPREGLSEAARIRGKEKFSKTIPIRELGLAEADGWVVKKMRKRTVTVEKSKAIGDAFEDTVWMVFYNMGFDLMNSTNRFNLSYSSTNPCLTKQIDVIAMDDETCLFIECKSTDRIDREKQWKTDIEAMFGQYKGLCDEISSKFGRRKFKYIFATNNYVVGQTDLDRIKDFNFAYFDEDTVRYYNGLANHLGVAAKYQLLGSIFAGKEIKGLEMDVPAIEGKMGKLTYYSFSIEPSKLLKVAYVLHRNNANHDLMPTYQRLIQKNRLKAIQDFVNNGGYFPNSLIISIDTNGHPLTFKRANTQVEGSVSRVGILSLPKRYQSAYIIDGQHRLYGYSGSKWESSNSIPVVAFVDLKKEEQLKLFMDINENQKAVPKSLRNTLNIDTLWKSDSYASRNVALMLHMAEKLGEDNHSPLYKRVITGENTKTSMRCLTTENLRLAFERTSFLNKYRKNTNTVATQGSFDKKDNDVTESVLYPFLSKALSVIQKECASEWEKGSEGFLTINNCIYALIVIINDFVKIKLNEKSLIAVEDADSLFASIVPFLKALAETLNTLSDEDINTIKTSKGAGGPIKSYNAIRLALNHNYPEYIYPELEQLIKEHYTDHNPEATDLLTRLLEQLREKISSRYPDENEWLRNYVPEKLRNSLISKKAIAALDGGDSTVWDFISFANIAELSSFKTNWSQFYKSILTFDGSEAKGDAVSWLKNLESYYNDVVANRKITTTQFQEIEKIASAYGID